MLTREALERVFQTRFEDSNDNWKACCPFHDERTPSFFVHKDDLIANCFGCGTGGSIDKLASEFLAVDNNQARQRLELDATDFIERGFRKHRGVQQQARQSYPESWLAPWRRVIHPYLRRRGFSDGVLIRAGVRYDKAKGRVVFPIRDKSGNLIGAVGRSVRGEEPRWYFYWGGEGKQQLYVLPGPKEGPTIVVEGPLDALWLEQHGYFAVATMGIKYTKEQLERIKELSNDEIYLALDQDQSGLKGAENLYQHLKKTARIKFVTWPQKDPVGLSKEQVDKAIAEAKNYVQWKTLPKSD